MSTLPDCGASPFAGDSIWTPLVVGTLDSSVWAVWSFDDIAVPLVPLLAFGTDDGLSITLSSLIASVAIVSDKSVADDGASL